MEKNESELNNNLFCSAHFIDMQLLAFIDVHKIKKEPPLGFFIHVSLRTKMINVSTNNCLLFY